MEIYWVDVEGGAATLVVAPSGESLLIDTGWTIADDRDAKRILAAAQQAGLKRIDYFVLSHYHADHAGGLTALARMIPIGRCFDRGDFIEPMNQQWRDAYLAACGSKRTIVRAGDTIPLKGVQVDVIASDGRLSTTLPDGRPNFLCATAETRPPDTAENQRMVATLFRYNAFSFLDLADLDWQKEMEFTCPSNKLGQISIWQAGRHGALDGAGAPGFLYAIAPQVVIVNNGPRKGLGGSTPGRPIRGGHFERISNIPGVEGIWQGHLSLLDQDTSHNTAENMIANLEDTAECKGNWLKASVDRTGRFTITNGRTGYSKTYQAR